MAAKYLLDGRRPGIFFIEMAATRHIPSLGSDAWAVYTLLVQDASQSERPAACLAPDTIASQSGLSEPDVRRALQRLVHHGLIETVEHPTRDPHDVSQTYRIVSVRQEPGRDDAWAREREARMAGRLLFKALIEVCNTDEIDLDEGARKQAVSAVETIRSAGGNARQVYDAAMLYQEAMPGLPLTPRNLAMCWPMLLELLPEDDVLHVS